MERLTKYGKTTHENGVCCTHFNSKECHEVVGNCAYGCKWEEEAWSKLAHYEDLEEQGLLTRVVHGEWEDGVCSVCKEEASYSTWEDPIYDYDWEENLVFSHIETHTEYILTNFCPNCGADMRKKVE